MSYFGKLDEKEYKLKYSLYVNIGQFILIVMLILMLALTSQVRVLEVQIPPGNHAGETFKIGVNDASDRTFEVWGEVFSNKVGNFSPKSYENNYKQVMDHVFPDNLLLMESAFVEANDYIVNNFITNKFEFKLARVVRKEGYVTVSAYGTATRHIGQKVSFEDIPYVFDIDMLVAGGSILVGRINGHIDENGVAGNAKVSKSHKTQNKFVNFE